MYTPWWTQREKTWSKKMFRSIFRRRSPPPRESISSSSVKHFFCVFFTFPHFFYVCFFSVDVPICVCMFFYLSKQLKRGPSTTLKHMRNLKKLNSLRNRRKFIELAFIVISHIQLATSRRRKNKLLWNHQILLAKNPCMNSKVMTSSNGHLYSWAMTLVIFIFQNMDKL